MRDALVEQYLGLAGRVARRFANPQGRSGEDVLQVARMALVKAVDRFDPDRGFAFATFAVPTIMGEIKRYFRGASWATHVSRDLQDASLAIERASCALTKRDGRSPTVSALAVELDISEADVLEGLQVRRSAMSFDAPVKGEGDGSSLQDIVGASDPGFERVLDRVTLRQAARGLSDRDRLILKLRFEHDFTQQQIADCVGLSQMQISRLLRRAFPRLREAIESEGPPVIRAPVAIGPVELR